MARQVHTYPRNPVDGQVYTSEDYKQAADINLWAAKMERLRGNAPASAAHLGLADLYIKQELRRAAG